MTLRESEYCPWGDRGGRQWDDHDNGRKDKRRHGGDASRDSYHGYGGEEHASMKRTRGNWEYNDLPEKNYSKEPLNRDRRRSPAGRSIPPRITPDVDNDLEREYAEVRNEDQELLRKRKELQLIEDQITNKKASLAIKQFSTCPETSPKQNKEKKHKMKHRRFTEGDDEDFKFSQSPEDFTHRQPPNDLYRQRPEDFKYRPPPKEFKHRQLPEDDFKYRQPPKEFKHRQLPEDDFKYRQPPKEFKHRQLPEDDFKYRQPPKEFKQRQPAEDDFKYRQPPKEFEHRQLPEDDFKYRQPPKEFKQRQLPEDDFKYRQPPNEFEHRQLPEDDFKYRQPPKEFKQRQLPKHKQQPEDFTYRQPLEYHKDEPFKGRNNDDLWDRTQAEGFPPRVHTKPRDGKDHHYPDYEDHRQNRMCPMSEVTRPANGQPKQDVTNQGTGLSWGTDEQSTAEEGFQRFLSVLNKGVDISKLTKIVCQTPGEDHVPPQNTVDGARQQESMTNAPHRGQNLGQDHVDLASEERMTELPCPTPSREKSLPREDAGGSHLAEVEKSKVTPEEEQKCRHMQDVLQAIGMDFGLEELGLMSNRIQERLYGKRDSEKREKETRRVYSPTRQSRSSSSGNSGVGHPTQPFSLKKDLHEAPRDIADVTRDLHDAPRDNTVVKEDLSEAPRDIAVVNQTFERGYTGVKSSIDEEGSESQQSTVAPHSSFSHDPTYPTYPSYPTYPLYPMPQSQAAPIMPTYPAGPYSPYTCSTVNTAVPPPAWGMGPMPYLPFPPMYPPGPPPTKPDLLSFPPYPPHPRVPQVNNYLPALTQKNTSQQPVSGRQLTYVNVQAQISLTQKNTHTPQQIVSGRQLTYVNVQDKLPKTTPWFTQDIRILKRTARKLEHKWCSTKLDVDRLAWDKSSNKYKCALSHAKKSYCGVVVNTVAAVASQLEGPGFDSLSQWAPLETVPKSQGKVSGDAKNKKTLLRLRLLVNKGVVKSTADAE